MFWLLLCEKSPRCKKNAENINSVDFSSHFFDDSHFSLIVLKGLNQFTKKKSSTNHLAAMMVKYYKRQETCDNDFLDILEFGVWDLGKDYYKLCLPMICSKFKVLNVIRNMSLSRKSKATQCAYVNLFLFYQFWRNLIRIHVAYKYN